MLTVPRLQRTLVLALLLVVAAGLVFGRVVSAAGIALFLFLLSALDPKPAWRWFYDAPSDATTGRDSRLLSWRRVGDAAARPRPRRPPSAW